MPSRREAYLLWIFVYFEQFQKVIKHFSFQGNVLFMNYKIYTKEVTRMYMYYRKQSIFEEKIVVPLFDGTSQFDFNEENYIK